MVIRLYVVDGNDRNLKDQNMNSEAKTKLGYFLLLQGCLLTMESQFLLRYLMEDARVKLLFLALYNYALIVYFSSLLPFFTLLPIENPLIFFVKSAMH